MQVFAVCRNGGQFEARQLVFIDEFGKKRKDMQRPYGIAPPGEQPQMVRPFDRFKRRVTVVGAVTIEGVVAGVPVDTTERGLNAAMFEHALEFHILPLMNPFPQPRSVLVLDGAPVHCKDRIQHMCAQRQIMPRAHKRCRRISTRRAKVTKSCGKNFLVVVTIRCVHLLFVFCLLNLRSRSESVLTSMFIEKVHFQPLEAVNGIHVTPLYEQNSVI